MYKKLKHVSKSEMYTSFLPIVMITVLIGLNIIEAYKNNIFQQHYLDKNNYNCKSTLSYKKDITLITENNRLYPQLEVIINGEFIDKFNNRKELTITVNNGDVIQINGSMYNDNIVVRINNVDLHKINYLNKQEVVIQNNIKTLAIIRI